MPFDAFRTRICQGEGFVQRRRLIWQLAWQAIRLEEYCNMCDIFLAAGLPAPAGLHLEATDLGECLS